MWSNITSKSTNTHYNYNVYKIYNINSKQHNYHQYISTSTIFFISSNQLPNLPAPQRQPLQCERFVPQATNWGETVPPCQTSPNPSSLNCLLHIDGRLWATQFGRQRPNRPTSSNSNTKKTSDHRIFSGHQNVVIKMSHHMVPGCTWYHVQTHQSVITNSSKRTPNCKGKRYYGASPILKHPTNSKPCLSWILDEPLGQQLQPLIRWLSDSIHPYHPNLSSGQPFPYPPSSLFFWRVLRWRLVKWRASTGPWLGQLLWPKKQKQEKIRDLTSLVQWLLLIQIILNRFEHHLLIPLKFSILKTE